MALFLTPYSLASFYAFLEKIPKRSNIPYFCFSLCFTDSSYREVFEYLRASDIFPQFEIPLPVIWGARLLCRRMNSKDISLLYRSPPLSTL
jgi:hypothetical protein